MNVAEVVAAALGREEVAGESYELTDCWVHERKVAEFAAEAAGVDAKVSGGGDGGAEARDGDREGEADFW